MSAFTDVAEKCFIKKTKNFILFSKMGNKLTKVHPDFDTPGSLELIPGGVSYQEHISDCRSGKG